MPGRELFDALMRVTRGDRPAGRPERPERLHRPSLARFESLRRIGKPVLLDGLLGDWSVSTTWFLRRFREQFGDRLLPAIPTNDGRLESDTTTGVPFRYVRTAEYIDALERGEHPGCYLATPAPWLQQMCDQLVVPEYSRRASWQNTRFWLSAPGTSTPLHRDVAENVFLQLAGRKHFYLYPPSDSPWLYSNAFRSALPNYSRFDRQYPDLERFPRCRKVEAVEVVLGPGEAMYLPSLWWHQVRSLDVSASYSLWFADGALGLAVRAAELVKRLRRLEIYGLDRSPPEPPLDLDDVCSEAAGQLAARSE